MKSDGSMTIQKRRRRYTEAFKAEVVRLLRDSAQPATQMPGILASPTICFTAGGLSSNRPRVRGAHASRCVRNRGTGAAATRKCHAEVGAGVFTTCGGVLREGVPMRYWVIEEYDRRYPCSLMCRALALSPARGITRGEDVQRVGARLAIVRCSLQSACSTRTVATPMPLQTSGERSTHRATGLGRIEWRG